MRDSRTALLRRARLLAQADIDIVQYRFESGTDKENLFLCREIGAILHEREKCFVVNNRVDFAVLSGADGAHIGVRDCPVTDARCLMGTKMLIGKTAHSVSEINRFSGEAVDYLSFGPLFPTPLKPRLKSRIASLSRALRSVRVPLVAIGGISLEQMPLLSRKGVSRIALCRDMITISDPISQAALYRRFLKT